MLCIDRGRAKVLGCMRDKTPLHGTLNSNDYGIEECNNIAMELKKVRDTDATQAANVGQGATPAQGIQADGQMPPSPHPQPSPAQTAPTMLTMGCTS